MCDRAVWSATKAVYSALIARFSRWEIAESFFNSLTRRVFATEGVNQTIEFVDTDFDGPVGELAEITRKYSGARLPELILRFLTDETAGGSIWPTGKTYMAGCFLPSKNSLIQPPHNRS